MEGQSTPELTQEEIDQLAMELFGAEDEAPEEEK